MSKYLLKSINKFRADTALEADALVSHFKKTSDVTSSRIVRRDKKDETYFIVEITVSCNDEREPFTSYSIEE